MLKRLLVLAALVGIFSPVVIARGDDASGTARIRQLKEARREQIVGKISDRLCKLFKNRPVEFGRLTENQAKRLQRIKTATAEAKNKGLDVSGVETLIAEAETAIGEVKTGIADLKTTSCPEISSDDTARSEASAALEAFKAKLEVIRQSFTKAAKAVGQAQAALARVLAQGGGE